MIRFAIVLVVAGGGGVVVSSPPYYLSAPEEVVVAHALDGGKLEIKFTNLRNQRIELKYAGDCCSVAKKWFVGPFESKRVVVRFDTSSYGTVSLPKTVGLEMISQGNVGYLRIPFNLKVVGE